MTKRKPKRAMRQDTRSAGSPVRGSGTDGDWAFSLDDELLTVGWTAPAEAPVRKQPAVQAQPVPAPETTWARDKATAATTPRMPCTRPATRPEIAPAPRPQAVRHGVAAMAFFGSDTMVFEGDPDHA